MLYRKRLSVVDAWNTNVDCLYFHHLEGIVDYITIKLKNPDAEDDLVEAFFLGEEEFIRAMLSADKDCSYAFAITLDNKVIGSIGAFRGENIHFQTAEMGYYTGGVPLRKRLYDKKIILLSP